MSNKVKWNKMIEMAFIDTKTLLENINMMIIDAEKLEGFISHMDICFDDVNYFKTIKMYIQKNNI